MEIIPLSLHGKCSREGWLLIQGEIDVKNCQNMPKLHVCTVVGPVQVWLFKIKRLILMIESQQIAMATYLRLKWALKRQRNSVAVL